ncbi:MAG: type II toxin-antitoxin system Phd/YefM family antitoxin [Anaerovoracaceae bacterium]
MTISATEFKNNLGKYLDMAATTNIYIQKKGKTVATLTSAAYEQMQALTRLVGIAKGAADMSLDDIREERIMKKYDCD